jgi:hypothetical protein
MRAIDSPHKITPREMGVIFRKINFQVPKSHFFASPFVPADWLGKFVIQSPEDPKSPCWRKTTGFGDLLEVVFSGKK